MLSLHSQSLPQLSLNSITNKPKTHISHSIVHGGSYVGSSSSSCVARAAEKDSQKFEIDPDEAKQALKKLDQQLKTLSEKQVSSPKIRAQDVKLTRDLTKEETQDISGSFLASTAVGLVIFTVLYNILFYAVIKPSIDGPDDVLEPAPAPATATATESPKAEIVQSLSQTPELSIQP